jgi:hypothetical protein
MAKVGAGYDGHGSCRTVQLHKVNASTSFLSRASMNHGISKALDSMRVQLH